MFPPCTENLKYRCQSAQQRQRKWNNPTLKSTVQLMPEQQIGLAQQIERGGFDVL
jgi:hypothetical protein